MRPSDSSASSARSDPAEPELGAAELALRLGLDEELGEGGRPRLLLTSELRGQAETVGSLRRFVGAPTRGAERGGLEIVELLELRLGLPLLGLAMERVIGFASRESAVPHILFSVVRTGAPGAPSAQAITADLLPRLDLMIHPSYADAIYGPLAASLEDFSRRSADACDEVSIALEGPLARRLLVSPWATRLTAVAGPPTLRSGLFSIYSERWVELVSASAGALERARGLWDPEPCERDRRLRAALSEARSDPLWRELTRLCGPAQADAVRAIVRGDG